jgi:hypothetical protein
MLVQLPFSHQEFQEISIYYRFMWKSGSRSGGSGSPCSQLNLDCCLLQWTLLCVPRQIRPCSLLGPLDIAENRQPFCARFLAYGDAVIEIVQSGSVHEPGVYLVFPLLELGF